MTSWITAFVVFALFAMGYSNGQGLSLITSSKLRMELLPTYERLGVSSVSEVELAIKSVLLLSTSGASNFQSVFDIDVVLQKIEWALLNETREDPSTILQFEVHMAFFKDEITVPSKYALDSLITRTFSRPSTKSTFLTTLDLSKDTNLASIDNVEVELVAEPSYAEDTRNKNSGIMSDLDIILITTSVFMFLGVIYIIRMYITDKVNFGEEQQTRSYTEWSQRTRTSRSRVTKRDCTNSDPNQTGLTSLQSDVDSTRETESTAEGTPRPSVTTSPERPIDDQTSNTRANSMARATPPISPCSSFPKSPVENSYSASPFTSGSKASSTTRSCLNAENLEALEIGYPILNVPSPANHLGVQLSTLPLMNPDKIHPPQSSVSTLDDFMKPLSDFSASRESSVGDMSSIFKRSTDSSIYTRDSIFKVKVPKHRHHRDSTVESVSSRSAASSERTVQMDNRCYDNNWSESQRKALEVDDDSSKDDVFNIDVKGHNMAQETRSAASEVSGVSVWMRSLRVVGSRSESAHSSVAEEHSSVGAKSLNFLEDYDSVASHKSMMDAATAPI
jgi:hypothetical protein